MERKICCPQRKGKTVGTVAERKYLVREWKGKHLVREGKVFSEGMKGKVLCERMERTVFGM